MADPVTAALVLQAGKSVADGAAGAAQAQGERQRASANSYIAQTRAIQTDTVARQGMESELATMRAVFGANQQRANVSTLQLLQELRDARMRERRINVGNEQSRAADWRMEARNQGRRATASMASGVIGAGPSMFDMVDYRSGNG